MYCTVNNLRRMSYKAVIFDMGGVLIGNPVDRFFNKYMSDIKEPTQDQINLAFHHPDFVQIHNSAERGEITVDEWESLLTDFCRKLFNNPDLPFLCLMSSCREFLEKDDLRVPQMTKAVKKVRENGMKTAVLTNNFSYNKEKTITTTFIDRDWFDEVTESCVTGLIKPDKAIFQYTLDKLNCKAEEVLFLDDYEPNFKGAHELGIKTILVKNPEEAATELLQLLNIA